MKRPAFFLVVLSLLSSAAFAQEPDDPARFLTPSIEEPVRDGDEVLLRGAALPGTEVVATMGAQTFRTTSNENGRWWLKFTPGAARTVALRVGKVEQTVALAGTRAPENVERLPAVSATMSTADDVGPNITIVGTGPIGLVVTVEIDGQVLHRRQTQKKSWKVPVAVPQDVASVAVTLTASDGTVVASEALPVKWSRHPLAVGEPQPGRVATPFVVGGRTSPGAEVAIRHGDEETTGEADEDGRFSIQAPDPERGPAEITVVVGPGTARETSTTVPVEVVNRLTPPWGTLIAGSALGTVVGGALGFLTGWGLGGGLYTCSFDCAISLTEVQVTSGLYGANWGAATMGASTMHLLSRTQGFRGKYATAIGAQAGVAALVWNTAGVALLASEAEPLSAGAVGLTVAGGVLGSAVSIWAYASGGDQTKTLLRKRKKKKASATIHVSPRGVGIGGRW